MPKINETINSPNQFSRGGQIPCLFVWHIMEGYFDGNKSWVINPASGVSSHFDIALDGRIRQNVPLNKAAQTNGIVNNPASKIILQKGGNPNTYSYTIEFEGFYHQSGGAITQSQLESAVWLVGYINGEHEKLYKTTIPNTRDNHVGHYEINSVTRPNCPGQLFPWTEFMSRLNPSKPIADNNVAYVTRIAYNENLELAKANVAKAKSAGFKDAYYEVVERVNVGGKE